MNSCFSSGFWEGTRNNEALRGKTIIGHFHYFTVSVEISADISEVFLLISMLTRNWIISFFFIFFPWIQPSLHPVWVERTIWNVWCLERRHFGWHPAHCTPVWTGCHDGFNSQYSRQMTTAGTPFKTSETTSPHHVWCIRNGNQCFCWLYCPSPLFQKDEFACARFHACRIGAETSSILV